ncbi:MAG: nucleotide exchange factor GrpE [Candidatus Solibacter usitatus]|nr:nucleotide exchange factor GrpE [Candidatus Solibacter usitatus]
MEDVKNVSGTQEGVADQSAAAAVADVETNHDHVESGSAPDPLSALIAERDQLAAERADLQNLLLRRQAEFDNFRKRVEKERLELLDYAGMDAVRSVLPITDDFERALKVECADKEYSRGMEMIHQRLSESLSKIGLEPMESVGQKFDPNLHHAVTKEQCDDQEEDIILEEYQRGYVYKGRLVRPAMVKVSVR